MRLSSRATAVVLAAVLANGCATPAPVPTMDLPRELVKTGQPAYVIEPPDLLEIDLLAAIPKAPYHIRTLDVLGIVVPEALPNYPIAGPFSVDPSGSIFLGVPYGSVKVAGKTLEEARDAIQKQLVAKKLNNPVVTVSLDQTRAGQLVRGQHLVRGDGTVGLGAYGSVSVLGLTLPQAKLAIEKHLQQYFQAPEISLDIVGYNSKLYYIIYDYGTAGQQIIRVPLTGSDTVLDGIGQTQGLPTVADARKIWVARPQPEDCPPQVLPVDWKAITEMGDTRTNYQLFAGDRVIVKAYSLVECDNKLARIFSPIERFFGVVLLGSSTVNSIRTDPNLVNATVVR
ncbi:MAG TPA: polysaccharide biosynthesis/export family protein [Fimbriiglobus sp.]